MDEVIEKISEWIKEQLITAIMSNLSETFESVNYNVGQIAVKVGEHPEDFCPGVLNMIRGLSENVIMPIAGIILTFIACYELIQLVISHNNLANFETWIFWKWVFKTFVAVTLISNTMNITMAVFDVAQHVVNESGGLITAGTEIDASDLEDLEDNLENMEIGALLSIYLQTFVVDFLIYILAAAIFVIVYGRMIEIYLMVSLAPIPFATFGNREQCMIGQNYLRSLFALGFQGFLIMVCVGIYAVLIKTIALSPDIIGSMWNVTQYTILLTFALFKTGSVAKSILHAH